jgi:hypothetical protein
MPCITVVDKTKQTQLDISYQVAFDDTMFGAADIPLSDSKTHQFFAIAGDVLPNGPTYQVYLFDEPSLGPIDLPNWITLSDVVRAAKASFDVNGAMFSDSDVPMDSVLASNAALQGRWQRITADNARLPIRVTQSFRPVHWNLTDVAPGLYSVAGYVFSPPYNDWAVSPGVVKVIDATHNAPAGDIASIMESVFSYQGRRVSACLDVPEGTQLTAYYRVEEQPEMGWLPWLDSRPVESGMLDLCFHTGQAGLAGSLRLRIDLTTADGAVTSLHSHDTMTWLQGHGACSESDTECCSFEPGPASADSAAPQDAARAGDASDAGVGVRDAGAAQARAAAHGCSVSFAKRAACDWCVLAALLGLVVWMRRRAQPRLSRA